MGGPATETKAAFHFENGQSVFCYQDNLIYEALILDRKEDGGSSYYIHFNGWDDKWNTWVPESRVLAHTKENEELRMKLRRENALTTSQGTKEKITMPEVLDNILYHEEEAENEMSQNWGDETICTYGQGYIDQPVYSCLECSQRAGKQFGFCYGCSMKCHVDHTVFELFDKRHFRCDCGVPRSQCECSLDPSSPLTENKLVDNAENAYNQNFDGVYCWCKQPYDSSSEVVMYMCVVCQDWYHEQCIKDKMGGEIPAEENFDDFFCEGCIAKHPLLLSYYPQFSALSQESTYGIPSNSSPPPSTTAASHHSIEEKVETVGKKRKREEDEEGEGEETGNGKQKLEELKEPEGSGCKLIAFSAPPCPRNTFWLDGWQQELCRCNDCLAMYERQGLSFLLHYGEKQQLQEEQDDVSRDTKPKVSLLTSSATAFATLLLPAQQIEMMNAYESMRKELSNYLKPFVESGREVQKEDIDTFFEKLSHKRRRLGK